MCFEHRRLWQWLLAVVAAIAFVYITLIERARLRIDHHIIVPDRPLPPGYRLRILHVSDLHVNGHSAFCRWRLRRYARQVKTLDYDIVVHTGDMLDNGVGIRAAVDFLREITGGRPAFTVLGNHDYHHYSWIENIINVHTLRRLGLPIEIPIADYLDELAERARDAGIVCLNNEGQLVRTGGRTIWIAGIDDLMLGEPNINHALNGASPNVPVVLLSHNPDIYPWADLAGVDLVLSGHTHGGQINLPGIGPVLTRCYIGRDVAAGLSRRGNSVLHVSRGLGETLPIRLNCPHHATIIEVRSKNHE